MGVRRAAMALVVLMSLSSLPAIAAHQAEANLDGLGPEWGRGTLAGKAAAVFSSTASMHGGQETTLISMMLPLLHHGMVVVGLPYTEADLNSTRSGGTPYGATHVSGMGNERPVTDEESRLAFALGRRLAGVARKLAA